MNAIQRLAIVFCVVVLPLLWPRYASEASQVDGSHWITIHPGSVLEGERIVGFEIHVHGGRIVSLLQLPAGWAISLENPANWEASAKGQAEVGAAAQTQPFLVHLLSIERSDLEGVDFNIDGVIFVSVDMEHKREIHFGPSQVSFER